MVHRIGPETVRARLTFELVSPADRDPGMDASNATRDSQRATVTVDREGIIHQWGDDVTEVVGRSAEEILGRNLNVIIPPALRWLHWWGFDRAMRRGRMSSGKLNVPALRSDGRIVVAHAEMELIPGDDGATKGAVVTFSGIGAPWQGTAWRAVLVPMNLAYRAWQRTRPNR
jgi:PAS domain S-box-containing protein